MVYGRLLYSVVSGDPSVPVWQVIVWIPALLVVAGLGVWVARRIDRSEKRDVSRGPVRVRRP